MERNKRIVDVFPSMRHYFDSMRKLRKDLVRFAQRASHSPWRSAFCSATAVHPFLDWIQIPPRTWKVQGRDAVSHMPASAPVECYLVSPRDLIGPEDDFRIEYTAQATEPSDLTLIVGHPVPPGTVGIDGFRPEHNGYCFAFGGFDNQSTELQRALQTVQENTSILVHPGQPHRCVAERIGGVIRFSVDGQQAYSLVDLLPFFGTERGYVGLYACSPKHRFRDLTVFVRPSCLPPRVRQKIDRLRKTVVKISNAPARYVAIHYVGTNIYFFEDVTEVVDQREQLEKERRHGEKMEAFLSLASAAAHEMNQPLTVIMGNAQLILDHAPNSLPPPLRQGLDDLNEATQRLADIVRKIGDIKQYETKPYLGDIRILDLDASAQTPRQRKRTRTPARKPRSAQNRN